ncbi:MAG: glycosyltransferase [Dermatophilaceae bacterium]
MVFVGRLVHTKGAQLLPRLAGELAPAELAIFGDGYLGERLQSRLGRALRGRIDQETMAGVLLWARGLAFTSLWPEPGGIVGIDAQLFGVPTAAFALGGPLDWPTARLVTAGDIATMAEWLRAQPAMTNARDPGEVSRAMARYWDFVARRAETLVETFIRYGHWPNETDAGRNAVGEALHHALETAG